MASAHKTKSLETFRATYEPILAHPASVNMYMFVGGTSWGFLSGSQNLAYDDLNTRKCLDGRGLALSLVA